MKKLFTTLLLIAAASILSSSGCGKNKKGCWEAWDVLFNNMQDSRFCDKKLSEVQAEYPSFMFCPLGETRLCWKKNGTESYFPLVPKTIMDEYARRSGDTFTQVDCASFCILSWAEKRKSKATGLYAPTQGFSEVLKNGDSCSRLFVGRVVTVSETADTIVTREVTYIRP
ncbi:MAG TPA: hypothetical protein PKA77_18250 [Chitinophagaceae bacterium]|mgnify:CR=1 FL=1|jgi:hypothetical protein|nr:hypothetical protein [Chitinophagaceae bacterium]